VEQPAEPSDATRRAPGRDVGGGAALLLAGILFALGGSALLRVAPDVPEAKLLAGLSAQALFACTALGGLLLAGGAFPRGLRLVRPVLRPAELLAVVAGFVCISHALSVLLASLSLRETGALGEIDRVVEASRGPSKLLAFLCLGIAPAFGEELLFRGLLQQSAVRRVGAAAAVLLSALAFGAIHLDAVQSPAAFVLGLYLGAAVEIGGSLWVGVICHAVNNSISVATPLYQLDATPERLALGVGALTALGMGLLGLAETRAHQRHPHGGDAPPPG
jgi:membrane protease YdiL (CAAX protease family)